MPHKILIVDDVEAARWAMRIALQAKGYIVCGEAVDGADAIKKAADLQPDLIVIDLKMPLMNGVEASTILRRRFPTIPVVLITLYDVGQNVVSAAGISAVLSKQDGITGLPDVVHHLLNPPPQITTYVISKP
jgi:DNA-binding NarL/FixJ family response regulator